MIRITVLLFSAALLVISLSSQVHAEKMYIPEGTSRSYLSSGGNFTVKATALTDGGLGWVLELLKGGERVSFSSLHHEPDAMAVSDNGAMIAVLQPSAQSEVGSEGMALYDSNWRLMRTVSFAAGTHGENIPFKMVKTINLSPLGDHCVLGSNGRNAADILLYETASGKLLWEKPFGFSEVHQIIFSPKGDLMLAATYERGQFDMQILLVDLAGKVHWEMRLAKNFSSYDIKYVRFNDDGKSFEVFDQGKNAYFTVNVPGLASVNKSE